MQEDIRISICIPTYNKSDTIEYTILSVIKQSYSKWELLIIDDSDNTYTEKLVEKFSSFDSRIKYIKNKERLGLVRNWNECITQSNYDYVYILHHDDLLMPGVLASYNNFSNEYPQCGLIHSNCNYITLPYYKKTIGITQDKPIIQKGDEVVEKILFNNNLAWTSVMVKRECYNNLGGFDESAWVSPDWEMWARIGKDYDFGHLDIIGCSVIIHNKNTHLSSIEVDIFYNQQQYYYNKIISYFSEKYNIENKLTIKKAKDNLRETILSLSIQYSIHLDFLTALSYLKKNRYYKLQKFPYIFIKNILKSFYLILTERKTNYKSIYESIFLNNNEN